MSPSLWSTAQAPDNGLSYWIEAICEAFLAMKADSAAGPAFRGALEQHALGALALNFIDADAQEVWRTPQDIRRSSDSHFYLLHIRHERLIVKQRGREALVPAGSCVLVDSKEPYYFSFPEGDVCLSIQFPERWLKTWLPSPEDLVARPWHPHAGGWGAVLTTALANLHPAALADMPLTSTAMADQLGSLMALAAGKPVSDGTSHRAALLRRIRATLNERYPEPDLDPAAVAENHGLSTRYVHRLFADAGTSFGTELIALRLQRAASMLADGRFPGLAVAEIAWRCGFKDPSHFARVFRRRFGAGPQAYRSAVR